MTKGQLGKSLSLHLGAKSFLMSHEDFLQTVLSGSSRAMATSHRKLSSPAETTKAKVHFFQLKQLDLLPHTSLELEMLPMAALPTEPRILFPCFRKPVQARCLRG